MASTDTHDAPVTNRTRIPPKAQPVRDHSTMTSQRMRLGPARDHRFDRLPHPSTTSGSSAHTDHLHRLVGLARALGIIPGNPTTIGPFTYPRPLSGLSTFRGSHLDIEGLVHGERLNQCGEHPLNGDRDDSGATEDGDRRWGESDVSATMLAGTAPGSTISSGSGCAAAAAPARASGKPRCYRR